MSLSLRTPSDERVIDEVSDKAEPDSPALANSTAASTKPHIALCASYDLREMLSASNQYEFIPFGKADLGILRGIKQSQIDGVLIHFEVGTEGMSEFIDVAGKEFPDLPCFVLCHQNDLKEISRYGWHFIGVRDLTSLSEIEEKLQRALFLFPWLKREVLRKILGVLKTIPSEAASHQRIVRELENPQFSLEHIAQLIKQDLALTAQLLKIVNSAAFLRGKPVQSVDEAVSILGALKLQALIASAWAFFIIDDAVCEGFHPKGEWQHAVEIAERVRKICEEEKVDSQTAETAIIAALLHDLGKLVLAANLPRDYAIVLKNVAKGQSSAWQVENELLGFNHAEVAGCLLGIWGVPLPVAKAVMYHHTDGLVAGPAAFLIQQAHFEKNDASLPK